MQQTTGQAGQTGQMTTGQNLVAILLILSCGIYLDLWGEPRVVDISCADVVSINYRKQANTISPTMVLAFSDLLPTTFLYLSETYLFYRGRSANMPSHVTTFSIGISLVYTSNNFLKFHTGFLRPYFLSVCRPFPDTFNCSHGYVQECTCHGDAEEVRRARISFPSLHASMTMFAMVYCIMYLWFLPVSSAAGRVAVLVLQTACVTWMTFVPISRVQDHRHHVIDVIAGSIWGTLFAVVMRQSYYGRPFRDAGGRPRPVAGDSIDQPDTAVTYNEDATKQD